MNDVAFTSFSDAAVLSMPSRTAPVRRGPNSGAGAGAQSQGRAGDNSRARLEPAENVMTGRHLPLLGPSSEQERDFLLGPGGVALEDIPLIFVGELVCVRLCVCVCP